MSNMCTLNLSKGINHYTLRRQYCQVCWRGVWNTNYSVWGICFTRRWIVFQTQTSKANCVLLLFHWKLWTSMKWAATWQNQKSKCAPSEDLDQPDAQADLSLRWAHMPCCWCCHVAAQIAFAFIKTYKWYNLSKYINERSKAAHEKYWI